jgi:hypothetical protein
MDGENRFDARAAAQHWGKTATIDPISRNKSDINLTLGAFRVALSPSLASGNLRRNQARIEATGELERPW